MKELVIFIRRGGSHGTKRTGRLSVVSPFSTGTESACDAYANLLDMSQTIHGKENRRDLLQ
jgi:hypothetical protein